VRGRPAIHVFDCLRNKAWIPAFAGMTEWRRRRVGVNADWYNKADLETSDRLVKACFDSQGYIEGRRAFMETRRPVFRGG
jgi:hypothetical protein